MRFRDKLSYLLNHIPGEKSELKFEHRPASHQSEGFALHTASPSRARILLKVWGYMSELGMDLSGDYSLKGINGNSRNNISVQDREVRPE